MASDQEVELTTVYGKKRVLCSRDFATFRGFHYAYCWSKFCVQEAYFQGTEEVQELSEPEKVKFLCEKGFIIMDAFFKEDSESKQPYCSCAVYLNKKNLRLVTKCG